MVISWILQETFTTFKEAQKAKNDMPFKYSGFPGSTSKSVGRYVKKFNCKDHINCPSQLKIISIGQEHSLHVNDALHTAMGIESCGVLHCFRNEIELQISSSPINILSNLRRMHKGKKLPSRAQIANFKATSSTASRRSDSNPPRFDSVGTIENGSNVF